MKKLKALSRAAASTALVLGTSFVPFALNGGTAFASTPLYWYGTGSAYAGTNTNTATASAAAETNWSTSNTAYAAATATGNWGDGAVLNFDTGAAAQTVTGQVAGSPAGIDVVHGGITLSGNTTSNVLALQTGATLKVDTPSTATNFLDAGFVSDSGALTLDGIKPAKFPSANAGGVTGPLTVLVSDTNVTTPANYTYTATNLTSLLGSASSASTKTVKFGRSAGLQLGATDFNSNATYWTFSADSGSTLSLVGSTTAGGTTYLETVIGNGGTIGVTGGTATVSTVTLSANSFASTPTATDVLAATTFTPNAFSFSKASVSDAGTFPTVASGTGTTPVTPTATGAATNTSAGGLTDTAAAPAAAAPATPDTGLALVAAHPLTSLIVSTVAAGALFFTARRLKPAARR